VILFSTSYLRTVVQLTRH